MPRSSWAWSRGLALAITVLTGLAAPAASQSLVGRPFVDQEGARLIQSASTSPSRFGVRLR